MAKNLLTTADLRHKAKPGPKEFTIGDGDDLFLRIRPSGHMSWILVYSLRGRRPKYTIGAYPTLSLAEARRLADEARALVAKGIHPDDERRRIEAERQAKELEERHGITPRTIADLTTRWLTDYCRLHHRDKGAYVKGMLERHALPLLGSIELANVRVPHIGTVLQKLKDQGMKRTAGVVLSNLRQMFCHAVEMGWLQGDPTAPMRKKTWAGPKNHRQRVLSEDEIIELVGKLHESDLAEELQIALWLMLACMPRVNEVGTLQLHELDFQKATWLMPGSKQKSVAGGNVPFLIDISPFAARMLKRLLEIHQEKEDAAARREERAPMKVKVDWLFPADRRKGPINEKTIAHALNDRQRYEKPWRPGRTRLIHSLELPGGKWTPHDLRRTGATMMRELGAAADVVDRCQNHAETDEIRRTYQRAKLRREMKEAWLLLGKRLEELYAEGLEQAKSMAEAQKLEAEKRAAKHTV